MVQAAPQWHAYPIMPWEIDSANDGSSRLPAPASRCRVFVCESPAELRGHPPAAELALDRVAVALGVSQSGSCPLDHGETWGLEGRFESAPVRASRLARG